MSNRARVRNDMNHARQLKYLKQGIVMLPTLREELGKKRIKHRRRKGLRRQPSPYKA